MENPLLEAGPGGLPRFDAIGPEHVVPALRELLAQVGAELETLERTVAPTWQGVVEPLERVGDLLATRWGVVGHLLGVRNSPALRTAHEEVQPEVVLFALRLAQSRPIYAALVALEKGAEYATLDAAQRRTVALLIRDARLAGVGLEGAPLERFKAIATELAEHQTAFSNHVLDATKAFALVLRERGEVEGLPESALELAAQSARLAGEAGATAADGPWRLTLDLPVLVPALQHLTRRDLRERLYRENVARASSGERDNTPLIGKILALRREESRLLGFPNFAALSLASKMAPDVGAARRLMEDLRGVSFAAAERELRELRRFARERGEANELTHWDVPYWAERQREARYAYSEEDLRPYFPLPAVLGGLFALAERLFGVSIRAADGDAPIWHSDVRFFRVSDESGAPLAAFYLDPYSRPAEKRGGAWMDECLGRSRLFAAGGAGARLPVAHLVCNQTPPVGEQPSLMSFDEVQTLFHEFGHGLQHMLTRVDYGLVSGIRNVEWDAVELPSQFMENWCYHRETLLGFARHFQTGAPLPDELFAKLCAARTYRAGSDMLRQLFFSLLDLELHDGYEPEGALTPFDVQQRVALRASVLAPLPEDRFLCSFGHIFAGGYAAGYYSYKWAEVLSADAFAAFEEAGLENAAALRATGRRYRDTVLGLGGSAPAMEVFKTFRGR
ncbi:MAG: M3 family metallopeptidase, partial [Myxococcota bacterium]